MGRDHERAKVCPSALHLSPSMREDRAMSVQTGRKYVYDFAEGGKDHKDLLGGKGANLAEMTNLGLPVPPGFTITTEACKAYLAAGEPPAELHEEVTEHLRALERRWARPWATRATRCWSRSARARSSPCPG